MRDFTATIESLDQEGRGVARREGKTVFVEGALTGENVTARVTKTKPSWEVAETLRVTRENANRVTPHCPHFGVCGGCSMQHADLSLQVAAKQRMLEETLLRIGNTRPASLLPAIYGPAWGYRYRARLSARYVAKKGDVLIGFHERRSSYVADMRVCPVLSPKIDQLLIPLRGLVAGLSVRDNLPQIEVAVGSHSDDTPIFALVLRLLAPLSEEDTKKIRAFADHHQMTFWIQEGGLETTKPFYPENATLSYTLPEYQVTLPFLPTDFTQVNHHINRVLARRAMNLLSPEKDERIADFFCGLGNFTLPIARLGATVIGIEGNKGLIARAQIAAKNHELHHAASFIVANLFENIAPLLDRLLPLDKALIDPPREGAMALVKALPEKGAVNALKRVVYVSCNPATLARDAGILAHEKGYTLQAAGIINMFPHTAHVESIAVFS